MTENIEKEDTQVEESSKSPVTYGADFWGQEEDEEVEANQVEETNELKEQSSVENSVLSFKKNDAESLLKELELKVQSGCFSNNSIELEKIVKQTESEIVDLDSETDIQDCYEYLIKIVEKANSPKVYIDLCMRGREIGNNYATQQLQKIEEEITISYQTYLNENLLDIDLDSLSFVINNAKLCSLDIQKLLNALVKTEAVNKMHSSQINVLIDLFADCDLSIIKNIYTTKKEQEEKEKQELENQENCEREKKEYEALRKRTVELYHLNGKEDEVEYALFDVQKEKELELNESAQKQLSNDYDDYIKDKEKLISECKKEMDAVLLKNDDETEKKLYQKKTRLEWMMQQEKKEYSEKRDELRKQRDKIHLEKAENLNKWNALKYKKDEPNRIIRKQKEEEERLKQEIKRKEKEKQLELERIEREKRQLELEKQQKEEAIEAERQNQIAKIKKVGKLIGCILLLEIVIGLLGTLIQFTFKHFFLVITLLVIFVLFIFFLKNVTKSDK